MVGRFNKHIPKLCCRCGAPMSTKQKRGAWEIDTEPACYYCALALQELYASEFEKINAGFWQEAELIEPEIDWDDYDWETE